MSRQFNRVSNAFVPHGRGYGRGAREGPSVWLAAKSSNLGFQSATGRIRRGEPERSRELLSLRFLRPGKMPGRRDRQDACVTLSALRLRQFHRRVIENED